MNENTLTKKQEKVFRLIGEYFEKHGRSPTIFELKEMLGKKSLRTVAQYLEILERKGFIYRNKYEKRGIRPIGYKAYFNPATKNVPVYGSAGCDNQSVFAEPIHGEYISVSKDFLVNKTDKLIAIKAIGNSMTEAGINNGDIVLVEKTDQVSSGNRVVAIIDDIAVIKKISFTENAVILSSVSKDESYKPIVMKKDFKIFGKVIDIIQKPKNYNEEEIIPIRDY